MKNIHVLPTDKPSNLLFEKISNRYYTNSRGKENSKNVQNQNIYIASDEEIKEGDYVCASGGFRFVKTLNNDKARTFEDDGIVSKQNPLSSCHLSNYKKIILTTDQDLIKDGVQAIDDEFLEWFVKNPNCEEVEVEKDNHLFCKHCDTLHSTFGDGVNCDVCRRESNPYSKILGYKIIIPNQKTKKIFDLPIATNLVYSVTGESKKQTIEEAARNYRDLKLPDDLYDAFIAGAKWQQERSYSGEDVYNILVEHTIELFKEESQTLDEFFNKFKKK